MKSDGKWFVRNTAGKVFGPIDFDTLQAWVRDGRVEPLAGISEDLQNWMLAPLKPELEMDWIVENNPGQFYGPTHKAVVDDFIKSGTLSSGARFYCDDHGKALKAIKGFEEELDKVKREKAEEEDKALKAIKGFKEELDKARTDLDKARTELEKVKTEKDNARTELDKVKTEKDKARTELDKAKAELAKVQAEKTTESDKALKALEDLKAVKKELDALIAEKEAVHAREWKTEVLVPEVVVSDEPPPSVARSAFGFAKEQRSSSRQAPFGTDQSSLAALERQAQAELARMGAAGAKKFFGIGKKK